MDGFSRTVLVHTSMATICWSKNNIGHYIPPGDWPTNSPDLSQIENIWSIMAAAVYASPELQTLTALKRRLCKSLGDQFLSPLCKTSSVQCLTDWRQSSETKDTTNIESMHCLEVTLSSRYCAIFGCSNTTEHYNCCWAAICIIFSSNNFIGHTYQMI